MKPTILATFAASILTLSAFAEEPQTVKVVHAKKTELFDSYYYPVVLEASKESTMRADFDSTITQVRVNIGDHVRVRQELLTLQQSKPGYAFVPYTVKSPIEGRVAAIFRKVEARVQAGTDLIQIVDLENLTMRIEVPEAEVNTLKPGTIGELKLRTTDIAFPVVVSGVSPQVSSTSGTAAGELHWVTADDTPERVKARKGLFPGMLAKVAFKINHRRGLAVAKGAISYDKKAHFVRVVADRKVTKREVKLGKEMGTKVEVISGLKEGDVVVVNSTKYLKDGDSVKPETEE